jgi:ABC-type Fe3+ transport system substrate-binding protein
VEVPSGEQATVVLSKARRPSAARLFSGFLVSKEGQQKIADLDNVVRKDVEPKIAVDRSKLRVINPAEGYRINYYMGLINDLFVKAN